MANSTSDIFRNNLKFYRNKQGYTQERLSEICNISTDYLSQIERGKRTPSFKRMELLAKALNIEVYKLFMPLQWILFWKFCNFFATCTNFWHKKYARRDCLGRSHLTAIPCFAFVISSLGKSTPASARSRSNEK